MFSEDGPDPEDVGEEYELECQSGPRLMAVHYVDALLCEYFGSRSEIEDEGWVGDHILFTIVHIQVVHSKSVIMLNSCIFKQLVMIILVSDDDHIADGLVAMQMCC